MRRAMASLIALVLFIPALAAARRPSAPPEGVGFILDSNRILLDLVFVTPEGRERRALVWFNMGMSAPILTHDLYRELGVDRGATLRVKLGESELEARAEKVVDGDGGVGVPSFNHLFAPRHVEAMLPARMFTAYLLHIDHGRRRFALHAPGANRPQGVPVPIRLNSDTGIAAVEAQMDGESHALAIDAGGGYSWMRGDVARALLSRHPDWRRAHGAVGSANANMVDFAFEKDGDVLRIPNMRIGGVEFQELGFLGTAPVLGSLAEGLFGDLFWDNWDKTAPAPIIGWLGGNALRDYELTIDYPNKMSYWRRERASDTRELDQPPITLVRQRERYVIGGIAQSRMQSSGSSSVEVGDELVAIDGLTARGASKDDILSALHGAPGERKRLTLERRGEQVEADVAVESFE